MPVVYCLMGCHRDALLITWAWPVYGRRQDRDYGEDNRFGITSHSDHDGRESAVIGELLQIPGHREVRAAIKEEQWQRCEAMKWGLFILNVSSMPRLLFCYFYPKTAGMTGKVSVEESIRVMGLIHYARALGWS